MSGMDTALGIQLACEPLLGPQQSPAGECESRHADRGPDAGRRPHDAPRSHVAGMPIDVVDRAARRGRCRLRRRGGEHDRRIGFTHHLPRLGAPRRAPVTANIANTVGLVPGSIAGAWGYRDKLQGQGRSLVTLGAASVTGAIGGAALLTQLPGRAFAFVVPVLILAAALLVGLQPLIARRTRPSVRYKTGPTHLLGAPLRGLRRLFQCRSRCDPPRVPRPLPGVWSAGAERGEERAAGPGNMSWPPFFVTLGASLGSTRASWRSARWSAPRSAPGSPSASPPGTFASASSSSASSWPSSWPRWRGPDYGRLDVWCERLHCAARGWVGDGKAAAAASSPPAASRATRQARRRPGRAPHGDDADPCHPRLGGSQPNPPK